MSEDRLKEIKIRYNYDYPNGDFFYEAVVCSESVQLVKDVSWLISELGDKLGALNAQRALIRPSLKQLTERAQKLEQCRDENGRVAEKFAAEIKRLNAILAERGIAS